MRIQTRLFFGTSVLVLALVAAQWWLHVRQLHAIERELGAVAATVGRGLLSHRIDLAVPPPVQFTKDGATAVWVAANGDGEAAGDLPVEVLEDCDTEDVHVLTIPEGATGTVQRRIERFTTSVDADDGHTETVEHRVIVDLHSNGDVPASGDHSWIEPDPTSPVDVPAAADEERTVELRVVRLNSPSERYLVVRDGDGERRIPIPVSPTQDIVRGTMRQGLLVSGGLLLLGLVASAVMATRLTQPLRKLAEGAEALADGELGVQVSETALGEVGELQRSFNRMSSRLAALESEREQWLSREHLAQLGDLSRGLAHTVRNPLNTLGLAVEELAGEHGEGNTLVRTARHQIRRIDRWLRSFLALGAGDASAMEVVDLGAIVDEVALEAIQAGARISLEPADEKLEVSVVPTAVRSAVANILDNAAEASADNEFVVVRLGRDGDNAVVSIHDRGPGLPPEVREKLYSPHVTTRIGGSGMGLFLARQLVVEMHGGSLVMTDRDGGGTIAEIRLPLLDRDSEDDRG
jgi:signal transduction histidine kinase